MKQQKAKYYAPIGDRKEPIIIPIETKINFLSLDEKDEPVEHSGTDDVGDWILVDFVTDKAYYFDYTVSSQKDEAGNVISNTVKNTQTTKEEWEKAE